MKLRTHQFGGNFEEIEEREINKMKRRNMDRRKNNLYMHKDDQTLRLFTARHGIKDQRDYSSNRRKGVTVKDIFKAHI